MNDLGEVEAFAMDMWEPYVQTLRRYVDDIDAKIVFDRFHIVKHMNGAVDLVRRQENKVLRADGDDRLVGTKYLWLYGEENLPTDRLELETRMRFAALRLSNLKTARAWALKSRCATSGVSARERPVSGGGSAGMAGPYAPGSSQ